MQVQRTSFFDGLPPEDVTAILSRLEERRFAAGSVVLAEGDAPREVYLIRSGEANIYIKDRDGLERLVGREGPGSSLGEMSVFTGQSVSATVRAASDLEMLALSVAEFHRVAAEYPRIYRNLGAVVAERMVRSERRSRQDDAARVTLLCDHGAPPLLGYALACSVAWHTRCRTALLFLHGGVVPPELRALAVETDSAGPSVERGPRPRADLHLLQVDVASSAALAPAVAELSRIYDRVFIQASPSVAETLPGEAALHLIDGRDSLPGGKHCGTGVLRAWVAGARSRPNASGVLNVAPPAVADEAAFRLGLLSSATECGRALGWQARDLAGLKVGIALGAGSFKGYAHIGVLAVLTSAGVPVDYIAGTSIGATVAALYAAGYTTEAAARTLDEVGSSAFRPGFPVSGLLSNAGIRSAARKFTGALRIEDLAVPLAVVAADIATQHEVVFRRGLLWPALLASVSIPGVYPAQRMGSSVLVDGGICNPVPSHVAEGMGADIVIAVRLVNRPIPRGPQIEATEAAGNVPTVIQAIMRSIEVMQSKISAETASAATIQIEPMTSDTPYGWGLRRFSDGRRYIAAGEIAAREALPRISAALPWLRD